MNEVTRFVRFTLPGLASVILLLIFLVLTGDLKMADILRAVGANKSVGVILGVFLGSGGLGFLQATVYFALYWFWPFDRLMAPDDRTFLEDFREMVEFVDSKGNRYSPLDGSRHEAWTIVNIYFTSRIKEVPELRGIIPLTDRLVNVTHALGATFVGTSLSFIAWLCIHFPLKEGDIVGSKDIVPIFGWLLLLFFIGLSRKHALKAAQSIANSAMGERIRKEFRIAGEKKVSLYYIKP